MPHEPMKHKNVCVLFVFHVEANEMNWMKELTESMFT